MKQTEAITVSLSAATRRKLARISQKSKLSPSTLIRHAVKKQLSVWESDGCDLAALASKMVHKSENDAPFTRKMPKTKRLNQTNS